MSHLNGLWLKLSVFKLATYYACHKISENMREIKALSIRIRKFVTTHNFFTNTACVPRIQRILRPFPEIFENGLKSGNLLIVCTSDTNANTCGRLYPNIFEYATSFSRFQTLTASTNKHEVQKGCSVFVSCLDF